MKRLIFFLVFSIPIIILAQKADSLRHLLPCKLGVEPPIMSLKPQVRIRCNNSTTTSNEPIIILDGVVLTPGNLSTINPNTIETITILKDSEAVSLCGSAARYGVILIFSKKGTFFIKDIETGQPISNASVKIKIRKKVLSMAADSIGIVRLGKENYQSVEWIEVSSVGYEAITWQPGSLNATLPATIQLAKKYARLEEVIVVGSPGRVCKIGCICYVKRTRVYSGSKFPNQQFSSQLSVYPNPVEKGGKLTVVAREAISGAYQIFSVAGALLQSGVITAVAEQPVIIATNPFPSGSYILRITNRTTGGLLMQKIIVQ